MIVPTLCHQGTTPRSRSIDDAIFVVRSEHLRSFAVLLIANAVTNTIKEDPAGRIAYVKVIFL